MGIIKVRTPSGVIQVRIAGDSPTEEESAAIAESLSAAEQEPSTFTGRPNLATMTNEEIREYARMRQQAGITATGEQMTPEEYADVYREEGVDYTQGLQDTGNFSRFGYGRMETDKERENYLRRTVGADGFRKDALGRFVLTQKGRQNLGMGAGPDLAIDEEGLSWGDFSEFLGENALPMAAGIGAGLMASGVGIAPGLVISGLAAGAGKALDEGIEYAQGLQDQTFSDVMRAVAFEGAFSAFGEGVGRVLSKTAGRLIKGPAGPAGEAARAQVRGQLERDFRPTISGGAGEDFRPLFGRTQAIYEAIFPNAKAAELNAEVIVKELEALRVVDKNRLKDFSDILKKDVQRIYGKAEDDLVIAERLLDTTVEKSLGKLFSSLRKEGFAPKDIIGSVQLSKRLFDENMDSIFTKVNNTLRGQAIIPTSGIKAQLERLSVDSAADVASTKFAKMVNDLPQYATVQDVARIRTALADATANPGLVADVNVGALGALKSSITEALNGAEIFLARAINMPVEQGKALGPEGFSASFKEMSEALGVLRRANALYGKGMRRFDNAVTQNIIAQARREGGVNEKFVFNKILEDDNPEALRQLLMAVRGVRNVPGLEQGERTAAKMRVLNQPIDAARRDAALLPEGSDARRLMEQEILRVEQMEKAAAGALGRGSERAEELRQNLAKMYLDKVVSDSRELTSTGAFVIDPVKFSTNIRAKGKVFDILFSKEKDKMDEMISVMARAKNDIAPSVLDDLMKKNPSLTEIVEQLKATQKTVKKDLRQDQLLRLAAEGDVDGVAKAVLQSSKNAKMATDNFDSDVLERVRDAAMSRILRQAGVATDVSSQAKMSKAFLDSFTSGSLGKSFQKVINSYGDEALDNIFGAGTAKKLNTIADDMNRVSNAAIRGKGGLVAAATAASLGGLSFLFSPLALIPAAAVPFVMSKALRNPRVLRLLMASRDKNTLKQLMEGKFKSGDVLGQGMQAMNQIMAQAVLYGARFAVSQTEEETQAMQNLARQRAQEARQNEGVNQMISALDQIGQSAAQAVTSPFQTLTQAGQSPAPAAAARANPILVPNPTTRATFGQ